ncbi:MAG TPA: PIG-L family deacetylase, partial [Thermoanaerobaculia bacterium]|nr:PIG-L family deacetylase [Thermoanaerobaculia bacterium]
GSTCAFLVLTRGEAGVCELPLCSPDLATVREQEMLSSAAIFGARVTQWSLPNVLTGFQSAWPEAGERIATAILDERPDVVITFDPLHGTTCHPAHRALGALVVDLVRSLDPAPPLYLLATAARLEEGRYRFQAGTVPAMAFDGTKWWQYSIEAALGAREPVHAGAARRAPRHRDLRANGLADAAIVSALLPRQVPVSVYNPPSCRPTSRIAISTIR